MQTVKALSGFNKSKINLELFCIEDVRGNQIFVEPRLLKLLQVLNSQANQVVRRDELVAKAWRDVVVTDESLSKAIFDLRKFLGEHFVDAPQIQTIRKVGYRLTSSANKGPVRRSFLRATTTVFLWVVGIISLMVIVIRAIQY